MQRGDTLVTARYDGDELILVVEGDTEALDDSAVQQLRDDLRGEVPSGTPVILNHVSGGRITVGEVP